MDVTTSKDDRVHVDSSYLGRLHPKTAIYGRIIGSYIRSWERPGDFPRVIEILCLFASGAQRNERKETKISITSGRSPGLSQQRM